MKIWIVVSSSQMIQIMYSSSCTRVHYTFSNTSKEDALLGFSTWIWVEISHSRSMKWALSLTQQSPVIMLAPCLGQGQRSSYTNSWESRVYYRLSADITLTSGKQKTISWLSLYYACDSISHLVPKSCIVKFYFIVENLWWLFPLMYASKNSFHSGGRLLFFFFVLRHFYLLLLMDLLIYFFA